MVHFLAIVVGAGTDSWRDRLAVLEGLGCSRVERFAELHALGSPAVTGIVVDRELAHFNLMELKVSRL